METKIAFVGSGYIAGVHLAMLEQINDIKIVAFCNPEREKAENFATKYNAKIYSNCEEMLESEDIDAVFVCVPPFAHNNVEKLIAKRGIPMLIEKPLALDIDYANDVLKEIKNNDIITSVGYVFRYAKLINKLKNIISNKKISLCLARYSATMPNVYWWKHKKLGGGQIIEQSTHLYDILRFLLGDVEEVQGFANYGLMSDREDYDVEDSSVVNLKFKSGAIGNMASNCLYPQGGLIEIELIGDAFRAEVSLSENNIKIIDSNGTKMIEGDDLANAYLAEDKAFIEAIRTKNKKLILCDYEEALKTFALTLNAINK